LNVRIDAADAAEAYQQLLASLLQTNVASVPGIAVEQINTTVSIWHPERLLIGSTARKFNYRSQISEGLWNMTNTDAIDFLCRYNSTIPRFVEDQEPAQRHRATWAYGPYIHNQFHRVVDELIQDPDSRRARISIQYSGERGTPPCLSYLQWFVRGGKLIQVTHMRSNDAWRGFPLDIVQFGLMGHIVAAALGVPFSLLIHQADSMHIYIPDLAHVMEFIEGRHTPYTLPYVGPHALGTAIRGDVLAFVEKYGHRDQTCLKVWNPEEGAHTSQKLDYSRVPGLESYAALLTGDYLSPNFEAPYANLKMGDYGIGW